MKKLFINYNHSFLNHSVYCKNIFETSFYNVEFISDNIENNKIDS